MERLPCAESGYVLTTKTVPGWAFCPPVFAQVRSMAADPFESSYDGCDAALVLSTVPSTTSRPEATPGTVMSASSE